MRGSFAWQIVLPVPILIGLALAAAALLLPQAVRTNVQDAALQSATQIAEQFKTIRGYYTQNVVGKVLATGTLKPSIDHKSDPNGIPLPATMIHDLSELLERQDTRLTLFSPFPFANRKDRQLDSFQQEAWSFLKSNPDQVFARQETRDGKEVYRVAVADRMSGETCVGCHNANPNSPKTDWKVGDVRGVLEVVTNIDRQLAAGSTLSNRIVLGGGLVGVALALVTVFFARRVANPIRGLTTAMKRLADGDHDAAIVGLGRKDEIGSMADAVGVFKENAIRVAQLQAEQKVAEARAASEKRQAMQQLADRFEKSVQGFVRDISASAGELEAASRTMSSVAGQTTEKSTIVASAADEASTNVQAVATAAEELTKSIEEISRQVVASSQIANSAVEKATTTNARVESLAEAAQKIGEVVSLISDIAAQTNLLALNATIEAARAGEAGKGFAVVASEVKNLATQTARATEDISAQVASIQAATGEAVTAIKDISETISSINEYSGSVASAVEEQTAATEEIARNIQQAAQGTSAVTTNIVDVTKAAAESGTAAESVQASAGNVATQSGDLKAATESFLKEIRAA